MPLHEFLQESYSHYAKLGKPPKPRAKKNAQTEDDADTRTNGESQAMDVVADNDPTQEALQPTQDQTQQPQQQEPVRKRRPRSSKIDVKGVLSKVEQEIQVLKQKLAADEEAMRATDAIFSTFCEIMQEHQTLLAEDVE